MLALVAWVGCAQRARNQNKRAGGEQNVAAIYFSGGACTHRIGRRQARHGLRGAMVRESPHRQGGGGGYLPLSNYRAVSAGANAVGWFRFLRPKRALSSVLEEPRPFGVTQAC